MSAYRQQETELTDQGCLLDALKEMKFRGTQKVEPKVCEKPEQLEGYQGDKRAQKADIIIPRRQVGGASNDIGFEKVNGKFVAHISDYDRDFYNEKWLNELKHKYAIRHARKIAKKNGMQVIGEKELANGKTRLVIRVNS